MDTLFPTNLVEIKKHNNVYLKVFAPASIKMGLHEHFARYAKNYQFQPKYRMRIWDGKIRFFQYNTGLIYCGLIKDILEYCTDHDLKVKIDDEVKQLFHFENTSEAYLENLVVASNKKQIELHDYQKKAIVSCITQKRRLVQSPTSSGKSLIIYGIIRYLLDHVLATDERILILVPTINLVKQMQFDFHDYSTLNQWKAAHYISTSLERKDQRTKQVLISTWQSVYKNSKDWFKQFRCLIIDEVHLATANSLTNICKKCDAEFRFGLSGSIPDQDEVTDLTLRGLFGYKLQTITTNELMSKGIIAKLKINCLHLRYKGLIDIANLKKDYRAEIEWIVSNTKRNKFILNLANKLPGNALILFSLVEKHGKILKHLAQYYEKELFFVYGGTDADQREKIRQIAETHQGCIILASYQTFSTGVNIKNINHIIFAAPTKSFTRVIQSIGRGLRKSLTKQECKIYDIFDEIYGSSLDTYNYTFKHFLERAKIYAKENFDYTISQIDLNFEKNEQNGQGE